MSEVQISLSTSVTLRLRNLKAEILIVILPGPVMVGSEHDLGIVCRDRLCAKLSKCSGESVMIADRHAWIGALGFAFL